MFRMENSAKPGAEAETITVSLKYYNIVVDLLGRKEEERRITKGTTVGQLLKLLAAENPSLQQLTLTTTGRLPPHMRLFRAGRAVLDPTELLADGDEIKIFPAISGG